MSPQEATVRKARITDVPEMVPLLRELFSVEADFEFDAARAQAGLELLLEAERGGCVWVAEADRAIIGMCSLQVLISTAEGGPVGLIEDVIVSRDYRGKGIGGGLLEAAEAWAKAHGLTRLQLLADRSNADALAFYDRMGWPPTQLICRRRSLR
jgi:GNAT superfamily N-acetyltransferase